MILALDLSLTATGYANSDGAHGVLSPPKGSDRGMRRLVWIRDQVLKLAESADIIVLEGYAFSRPEQAHYLGELGGVVRCGLFEANRIYVDVQPSSLKMFATGKGNAKKDEVLAEAIRQLGYLGYDNNVSDALWLLELTRAQYSGEKVSEVRQRALSKIPWPAGVRALEPAPNLFSGV